MSTPADLVLIKHLTDDAVHRPSREPGLVRVRRGAYAPRAVWDAARPEQQHKLLVLATVASMRVDALVSHESAAVLHGIPLVGTLPAKVHVIEPATTGGRSSGLIVRHGTRLPPAARCLVGGVAVTSPARTVVDLARTRSFVSALAAADHALAHGMATVADLADEVETLRGGPGYRRARRVIACADARSGSVGESVSRAQMHELRLPIPELQRVFEDGAGFAARTDFWWAHLRLVGEFDGRAKYQREGYAGNRDPGDLVWAEKVREDRLRRLGLGVVRWTWDEARDRERFAKVLAGAGVVPHD